MAKDTKAADLKKKKKKWVPILATKDFNSVEIGETFVDEQEKCLGKTVSINLMNLTKDPKRQSVELTFIVTEVKNNEAQTDLIAYEMVLAHLKRVSKKARERVDNSFEGVSQDNIRFRIKPILMTKGVAHKSVCTMLRKNTEEYIAAIAKKTTFNEIMKGVIMGSLQKEMKGELRKVYPLSACLIKSLRKFNK